MDGCSGHNSVVLPVQAGYECSCLSIRRPVRVKGIRSCFSKKIFSLASSLLHEVATRRESERVGVATQVIMIALAMSHFHVPSPPVPITR
jgi:hypothetical protein